MDLKKHYDNAKSFLEDIELPCWKTDGTTDEEKYRELAQKCRQLAAELDQLGHSPTNSIEAFFATVGQGVVGAQQTLDDQTANYLAKKSAFPTAFRIPKASAEIQFSASERVDGGFFARIFTGTEATENKTKHKVTFDIVAAPLPPELAQQPSLPWMSAFVVTDLPTRRFLLKEVEKFRESLTKNGNPRERANRICTGFNSTVILQAGNTYAILLLQKNGDKAPQTVLEVIRLDPPGNDGNRVASFVDKESSLYPRLEPSLVPLYDLFLKIIEEQEARLGKLDKLYPPTS